MNKRIYLKNPIRLVGSIIGMIILTIMIMIMFQGTAYGESIPEYKTIVVAQGDTLWTIAKDFYSEEQDIRNKIEDIKELNNLKSSTVKAGQELILEVNKY